MIFSDKSSTRLPPAIFISYVPLSCQDIFSRKTLIWVRPTKSPQPYGISLDKQRYLSSRMSYTISLDSFKPQNSLRDLAAPSRSAPGGMAMPSASAALHHSDSPLFSLSHGQFWHPPSFQWTRATLLEGLKGAVENKIDSDIVFAIRNVSFSLQPVVGV